MYHVPAGAHGRLLDAPGIAILERSAGRRSRWWVVVIVLAVGLTILPLSLFAFGPGPHSLGGDGREHLLGGTEEVTAQVDAAVVDGYCRRESRDRYRLELSWQSGPPPGHSAYLVCGEEFAVGDRVQVWVDSGGAVFLDTPNEARFGMGGLGLVLGIATVGVGAGARPRAAPAAPGRSARPAAATGPGARSAEQEPAAGLSVPPGTAGRRSGTADVGDLDPVRSSWPAAEAHQHAQADGGVALPGRTAG